MKQEWPMRILNGTSSEKIKLVNLNEYSYYLIILSERKRDKSRLGFLKEKPRNIGKSRIFKRKPSKYWKELEAVRIV